MLPGGELLTDEVTGTTSGDRVEVNIWRGGALVAGGLEVSSWSLDWDADRQVQGQATIEVADPDGELSPWGMGDPLAPGGSRAQLTWVSGSSDVRVPVGWWRLRRAVPAEQWRLRSVMDTTGTRTVTAGRVPGGGSVSVRADELTCIPANLDRLDAEGQPPAGSRCLSEVARLLRDIMPVVVSPAVVDRDVPSSLVYGEGRMDAVEDLLTQVDAVYRMGGDGSLQVLPAALGAPVWTIDGGDEGALINVSRALSDEGVYNAVTSTGTSAAGEPLVGRDWLRAGPLKWGVTEPYGRVPAFHRSIAQTAAGVQSDAVARLASLSRSGQIDLPVVCLAHPGIQLHDAVTVVPATIDGDAPLVGRVVRKRMASAADGIPAKSMDLTVRVSVEALEVIAARVAGRRRG
ncbi:hypothetical protein CHO01_25140 [Cellulomonas hominis]|uniref:DUF5047 domain-containing protein n=1 Tax=Cellulomonas hominis TaxID=156981 RepID=A0A511FHV4_9CELL|nr:hypothetical protein [Cellulomonas hominis]MBB5472480.1 hypothetical protein [Cellulomonas hominis]NKY05540.1 hypothetical protein [Cellulomonas hominis]GEL47398.1 hypothetical protein CHO01_25140 [Cellulomonas hominis]